MQHTSGPWTAESGNGIESVGTDPPTGIAILEWDPDFWGCGYRIPDPQEMQANACLLAHAVDLLTALEGILAVVNVRIDDPRRRQFDVAHAAVAKAKGGV